jgi:bacillithiol system protein YtxJ
MEMAEQDIWLDLPEDSLAALEAVREASRSAPVLVFKKSPICPASHVAEGEMRTWLEERDPGSPLKVAVVDVLASRSLARGLTSLLEIRHESPQALLFVEGELRWHDSHGALSRESFAREVDRRG